MSHLKLVEDIDLDRKRAHNSINIDEIESTNNHKSEIKTKEDAAIINNIDQYSSFFLNRKLLNPAEDYSKFFLIFSYNYYLLNKTDKARQMLTEISPSYFNENIISDMSEAMEHRNKADEYKRKRKYDLMEKHQMESEFFLVVIYILPFLKNEPSINNTSYFKNFLKILEKKTFSLRIAPSMDLISEES